MILDHRRAVILQTLEKEGFVSLAQLTELLQTSESTVRRDLESLEGSGQIRRLRGGAAYCGESLKPFEARANQSTTQKQEIGRAAAALVQPDDAILIDGGTTTLEMARCLAGPAQVVTNSIPIAHLLANQTSIELTMIGGVLFPKTGVALGPIAQQCLSGLHPRRLFMGAGGVSGEELFNSNQLLVDTERRMIEVAEEVILLVDHTKFGHRSLVPLCRLEVVDHVITDAGLGAEWKQRLEGMGIRLTIAGNP